MGLNIGGSGAGFTRFIKYNAKAGRWFLRDEAGEREIPNPAFVADFDNIATGWLQFQEGQAPQRRMDPDLQTPAPSPGVGSKRGFVMRVYSQKFLGGAAEFSGNSIHLSNAFKDVYAEWEAERGNHPGQLPVLQCTGVEPMKDKHGTNYRPVLKIVQWADRPVDLPDASPVDEQEIWQGGPAPQAPAKAPAQHVPPPAPKSEPLGEVLF
jgi:hypothetical protein